MKLLTKIWNTYGAPYLKAHSAGLGAGLVVLTDDCSGNIHNLAHLSGNQWLGALAATGMLGVLTGFVRNTPAPVLAPVVAEVPAGLTPVEAVVDAVSQDTGV